MNTYTNLAYLAAGLVITVNLNTLPSFIFCLASLYLCAGSALYHATSTRWAGHLDVSAMYALASALVVYALATHIKLADGVTALLMFVVAIASGYLLRYRFQGQMHLKIAIFKVATYALVIASILRFGTGNIWYVVVSFALFGVAFLVWTLDRKEAFPIARWGHGFWHILTAAAYAVLFYAIYLTR